MCKTSANLAAHESPKVETAIGAKGAWVLFLPPYIRAGARKVLKAAAAAYKKGKFVKITLAGHADLSGPAPLTCAFRSAGCWRPGRLVRQRPRLYAEAVSWEVTKGKQVSRLGLAVQALVGR